MNIIEYIIDLFKPRLGNVLAQFETTALKLEQVVEHQAEKAEKHAAAAVAALAMKAEAEAQVAKAKLVGGNIKKLLGA